MSAEEALGWSGFRAQFPVLARYVYLNAGTEGPVSAPAAKAISRRMAVDLVSGRIGPEYLEAVLGAAADLRAGYAKVLGADPGEVALTDSTTSGINTVLSGLSFAPGDEILTSDQEHPGLLAPLRRLALRAGVRIRVVGLEQLSTSTGPHTRLIACSHVAWVSGQVADVPALMSTGVPVLLDGAQALGAIPVDVHELGVDYYAGSGQKWLCGPESSGALYVRPDRLDRLEPPWPGYGTVADPYDTLNSGLAETTARLDLGFPSIHRSLWALAALELFRTYRWEWVFARASFMAATLATELGKAGIEVLPRGATTLVSWRPSGGVAADAEVDRLRGLGILVRSVPTHGVIRASCGAWTSEEDVRALVEAISG